MRAHAPARVPQRSPEQQQPMVHTATRPPERRRLAAPPSRRRLHRQAEGSTRGSPAQHITPVGDDSLTAVRKAGK